MVRGDGVEALVGERDPLCVGDAEGERVGVVGEGRAGFRDHPSGEIRHCDGPAVGNALGIRLPELAWSAAERQHPGVVGEFELVEDPRMELAVGSAVPLVERDSCVQVRRVGVLLFERVGIVQPIGHFEGVRSADA